MFKALFSARGRMRRRDWWLWRIGVALAYLLSLMFMHSFFGTTAFTADIDFKGGPATPFHYWDLFLLTVGQWPYICVDAKRWHDRGRPGWLAVVGACLSIPPVMLMHFGPLAAGFAPQFAIGAAQAGLGFASLGFSVWVLIDCGILDGTQGPNRYGPSPKGMGDMPEDVF